MVAIVLILFLQGYLVVSASGGANEPPTITYAATTTGISGDARGAGTPWYAHERTLAMRLGRMG
jgi:hypothetical protein